MADRLPSHIYSVMIALEGDNLLVPNSAVAEVLGQETFRPVAGGPRWHLGALRWEGLEMPVLSIEGLLGKPPPELERKCRVVILHAPSQTRAFAMMGRAYPMIVTLNEVAMTKRPLRTGEGKFLFCRANVANRQVMIPDLDAISAAARRLGSA